MAATLLPLQPGDPLPALSLPTSSGGALDLTHQSIAGSTLVLIIMTHRPDRSSLRRLAREARSFDKFEARLFVVLAGQGVGGHDANQTPSDIRILQDPDNLIPTALGLEGTGTLVVDASGRIATLLPDADIESALDLCHRLFERTAAEVMPAQAPILVIPDVLEPPLCKRLIAYWHANPKLTDRVATSAANAYGDRNIKKRGDVAITDKDLFNLVKQRLGRRVIPEARKVFQVSLSHFEAIRIGCYDGAEGGYFRLHRDNRTPYTAHRQFAMTLSLNAEYEGGYLRFPEYGRMLYRPPPSGAVVFSCNLLHEVMPVTRGKRFILLTFLFDEVGAKREAEMRARATATGRTGVQIG